MATPSSKKKIPLFVPGQGATMVTDRPAMTLKQGEFADLTNFRCRDGALKVRPATSTWAFTGLPATPEFCASWSGTYLGQTYVILAIKNGTAVDLYDSPDGLAFTKRSAVAAAPQIYPDTSLSYANWQANGITFIPFKNQFAQEGVLISDGVSSVVWCPELNLLRVRKVSAFTGDQPKDCAMTGSCYFLWNGADITTISGTGSATFTYTEPFGVQVAIANPQTNGNQLELQFTAGSYSLTQGSQLFLLVAQTDVSCTIFESCKLEVYNGTTWFTIFDPTGTDNNDPSVEVLDDDYGIGSPSILYTWGLINTPNTITGSLSRIRFTYTGTTTKYTAATIQILAVGGGAKGVAGTPDYGVSYYSNANFCESPFTVLDSAKASGALITMLTSAGTKYFKFPISDVLRLYWSVKPAPYVDPSIYNVLILYRRDPGSTQYLFCASQLINTWTDSLSVPNYTWVAFGSTQVLDEVDETGLNPEIPAPSAYNGVIGGFTCGTVANDRVIVGSSTGYKFSEFKFPLRFSSIVDPDNFDRSSGKFAFPSEVAKAIVVFPTNAMVQQVGIFTDQSLYSLSGLDAYALLRPGLVSRYGTKSGKSVATRRGDTFILDDALHITQFPPNATTTARSMDVKNILEGIPTARLPYVNAAVFGERYYLFYTQEGRSVNDYAFVLDLLSGTLQREFYGNGKGVVTTFQFEGNFVGCLSDGTAIKFEATPTGSVPGCSVLTREVNAMVDTWSAGRQIVYCSDSSSTPNAVWNNYPEGQTVTSPINLDSAGTEVRTERYTALGKGIRGKSVQLGLSGTFIGGTEIYSWQVETEDRVSGADVS